MARRRFPVAIRPRTATPELVHRPEQLVAAVVRRHKRLARRGSVRHARPETHTSTRESGTLQSLHSLDVRQVQTRATGATPGPALPRRGPPKGSSIVPKRFGRRTAVTLDTGKAAALPRRLGA